MTAKNGAGHPGRHVVDVDAVLSDRRAVDQDVLDPSGVVGDQPLAAGGKVVHPPDGPRRQLLVIKDDDAPGAPTRR